MSKKTIHILFPMLLTGLVLLYSCVKEYSYRQEVYEQDQSFFKRNAALNGFDKKINGANADEYALNKVIEQFKSVDNQRRIVPGIKKQHGLALWDLSVIIKNANGNKTIVTPLKHIDSDTTEALLFSYIENGKTRFKIVDSKAKHQRLNANGTMAAKEFTQSTVKGLYKACNESITRSKSYISGNGQGAVNLNSVVIHWVCWNYYATYTDPSSGVVTAFATTVQCSYSIVFTGNELEYLDPSYYNDPTGGGGGGSYIEDWTYINVPVQNQSIIDSLNGYPCAQQILAQMINIDSNARSIIHSVFGVNSDVNLKYAIDNTLGMNDDDGYTNYPGGSLYNYNAVVMLNPWVLQNSTKEFIFATMLHESIHAHIYYYQMLYTSGQIDSNQLKTMFPIFWNHRHMLNNPVDLAQHNQMANDYVTLMANAVKAFNPQVSDSIARSLAWGGLNNTTMWSRNSDTTFIKNFNATDARNVLLNQYFQYNLTRCN
jgi:hypothetical protein